MTLVNVLAVIVVVFATGAFVATAALWVVARPALAHLENIKPEVRARWLFVVAALPAIAGALLVAVAFGPCLHNLLLDMPDGCRDHGGPAFFFCLRTVAENVPVAWAIASLLVSLGAARASATTRSLLRTRAALASLRRLGTWDAAARVWMVPGSFAVVAGFPRSEIFLGEEVKARVASRTLDAVLAHERAHMRRRDLRTKLAARLLAACLPLPALRKSVLAALDLALEEACDAVAAEELHDRFLVASSLVDLAAVTGDAGGWAIAFTSPSTLEARVRALCEPCWRSSTRLLVGATLAALLVLGSCIAFDPKLHDLTEAAFGRLLRA